PQTKSVRWGKLPSLLAIAGPDDGGHLPRLLPPVPTSTRVPTTERTIWWQKALASISKRRIRLSTWHQPASRTNLVIEPSGGLRQKAAKSCDPRKGSHASCMARRSSGASTCQAVPDRNGSATASFNTV